MVYTFSKYTLGDDRHFLLARHQIGRFNVPRIQRFLSAHHLFQRRTCQFASYHSHQNAGVACRHLIHGLNPQARAQQTIGAVGTAPRCTYPNTVERNS